MSAGPGVDTERFAPDPSVVKEPLVVFVGRFMPHKGMNDQASAHFEQAW